MKYNLVIIVLVTILYSEIYCIVPKYKPNISVISQLSSVDDVRYRTSEELQTPEIVENNNKLERNDRFGDVNTYTANNIRNMSKKLQKVTINFPSEEESKKNRLPEVNLKDIINSKEIINDESVEDFVDLSFEEIDSTEKEGKINADKFHNNEEIIPGAAEFRTNYISNRRAKRENDVMMSIRNKSQVKKLDKNVAKSLRKRNSNVIEEENLVTTISIFKFTGRPSRLNEHLVFKNINP